MTCGKETLSEEVTIECSSWLGLREVANEPRPVREGIRFMASSFGEWCLRLKSDRGLLSRSGSRRASASPRVLRNRSRGSPRSITGGVIAGQWLTVCKRSSSPVSRELAWSRKGGKVRAGPNSRKGARPSPRQACRDRGIADHCAARPATVAASQFKRRRVGSCWQRAS